MDDTKKPTGPANDLERRWISRAHALGTSKSDAELVQQYRDLKAKKQATPTAAASATPTHADSVKNGIVSMLQSGSRADLDRALDAMAKDKALKAPQIAEIAKQAGVIRVGKGRKGGLEAIRAHAAHMEYARDVSAMAGRDNMWAIGGDTPHAVARKTATDNILKGMEKQIAAAAVPAKPKMSDKQVKALLKERVVTKADVRSAKSQADLDALAKKGRELRAADRTPAVDPIKLANARLETARAQAAIAKSTGNKKWAAEGLRHVADAERDIAKATESVPKPKAPVSANRQKAIDAFKTQFGFDPPKSMPIKRMNQRVEHRQFQDRFFAAVRAKELAARQPMPTATPAPPASVPPGTRAPAPTFSERLSRVNPALSALGVGVAAGQGFHKAREEGKSVGEAALEAGKSAAIPGAIALAPHVGSGMVRVGKEMMEIGMMAARDADFLTGVLTDFMPTKLGLLTATAGAAVTGVGKVAQAVGKVALPALAGYSAWQGAREDENTARGAGRGLVRAFDPSALFMSRGLGERAYDSLVGGPKSGRLTSVQQQQFAQANAAYKPQQAAAPVDGSGEKRRGWANPQVQMAAQQARGVENVSDWVQDGTR